MPVLAAMVEGETVMADVLFLAAFIVFVIAAVIRWRGSVEAALVSIGLALVALGWFVL